MIDNPCDHAEEIRELKRMIRELATHSGLGNSAISSGSLQVATPEGIYVKPGASIDSGDLKVGNASGTGSVKAGPSEFSKDGVSSGGTKIGPDGKIGNPGAGKVAFTSNVETSGSLKAGTSITGQSATVTGHVQGGSVSAGGTWIRPDGKISNDFNDLKFASNSTFEGNVKSNGTVESVNVWASGEVEAGGTKIRASDGKIASDSGEVKFANSIMGDGSLRTKQNVNADGFIVAEGYIQGKTAVWTPWEGGNATVESIAGGIKSTAASAQSTANSASSAASTAQSRANSAMSVANNGIDYTYAVDVKVQGQIDALWDRIETGSGGKIGYPITPPPAKG